MSLETSNSKILSHLINTNDNKHISLQESKEEAENIYKFKYLHAQNDRILIDDTKFQVGSYSGVLLNRKLTHMNRLQEGKALILSADQFERRVLDVTFNKLKLLFERRGLNYGLKGFLGLVFVNSILNTRHRQERLSLVRKDGCAGLKRNVVSFICFAGSLVLI